MKCLICSADVPDENKDIKICKICDETRLQIISLRQRTRALEDKLFGNLFLKPEEKGERIGFKIENR